MIRRTFFSALATAPLSLKAFQLQDDSANPTSAAKSTRSCWIDLLTKISNPVLKNLAAGTLKKNMPVEQVPHGKRDRKPVSHLEALGRTAAGIAPWLELGTDESAEGTLRRIIIDRMLRSIERAVNPASPDFMNFTNDKQPLVDAAFLAEGLLRAPKQLTQNLDAAARRHLLKALRSTRAIIPGENNWVLFAAIIEAFFISIGEEHDEERLQNALKKISAWYKGDGAYGDGPNFHWDYYNSLVIHPMLLDCMTVLKNSGRENEADYQKILQRSQRYAAVLERFVAPDGSYPPIGRSLPYRCGSFHALAQIAYLTLLPEDLSPAQVRCALDMVIKRTLNPADTFDPHGWLTIGIAGHQPSSGEDYLSTGSIYLCTTAFLPLGLRSEDPFWSLPDAEFSSQKVFNGRDVAADHALKDS